MPNAVVVYTSLRALNGRKLAEIAGGVGIQLRFLALGGYIPSNLDEIQSKGLTGVNGGALLLIGGLDADSERLVEFDTFIQHGDRPSVAALLNSGNLPWCELYTGGFSYEKLAKQKPKDKATIDKSVPRPHLPAVKAARTRYIIHNQSRRKNGGALMTRLADALALATDGIVADCPRPSR